MEFSEEEHRAMNEQIKFSEDRIMSYQSDLQASENSPKQQPAIYETWKTVCRDLEGLKGISSISIGYDAKLHRNAICVSVTNEDALVKVKKLNSDIVVNITKESYDRIIEQGQKEL